jgi:voltage-gated potassium channel Kch
VEATVAQTRVARSQGVLRAGLRLLRNVQILAALIIVAALVLGYIGLSQYLSGKAAAHMWGDTWDDILFYDLQMPVLSAAPLQQAGDFPVALSIARFLAPIGTSVAAFAALKLVLGEQWRGFLAARSAGHAVVAGDGAVALTLARRLGDREPAGGSGAGPDEAGVRKAVLVSASEDTLTQARQYGILAVRGDPADEATLRAAGAARAAEIYACTATGTANAAIALRARAIVAAGRRKQPLSAYALVRDAELGAALRARRIGADSDPSLRLDFFGVEEIAARKLFDAYPLNPADGQPAGQPDDIVPAKIVIVGFGALGLAVLREAARRRPREARAPKVEVFIERAARAGVLAQTAAFPAIAENCSVTFDADQVLPAAGAYTVFVCIDDDDHALREGLGMAHALASRQCHVVVCMRESSPFADILAKGTGLLDDVVGRITVFGVLEAACVPATIREDFIEQIARAIHQNYLAKAAARDGKDADGNALDPLSLLPWERLSADLKAANVGQALSFGPKVEAVGAVVIPESATPTGFRFTDQEIEDLSVSEHDRWMSERLAAGWTYGVPRDNTRKLHPALLPWAELPEAEREKDRDAVRAIPPTLGDAGFQILRLPALTADNPDSPFPGS